MLNDPKFLMSQINLDVINMVCEESFSDHGLFFCAESVRVRTFFDAQLRAMIAQIAFKLISRKFKDVEQTGTLIFRCKVDADWWQSFRARWAPRWWLKRHPVKQREIVVNQNYDQVLKIFNVCPHLKQKVYDQQAHVQFLVTEPASCTFGRAII